MDTALYAIPEAVAGTSYEYLLHHSLSLAITASFVEAPARLLRWAPMLLLCEASSIPFCVSYICRKAGARAALVGGVSNALFVALFVLTRIVHLPASVAALALAPAHAADRASIGAAGFAALAVIVGMQLMWLSAILAQISDMARPKRAKAA